MHQEKPPNSRILDTITALPWLGIWMAALSTLLQQRSSDIPFELPLAAFLTVASPLIGWYIFRR
jgi:hypothetical protein